MGEDDVDIPNEMLAFLNVISWFIIVLAIIIFSEDLDLCQHIFFVLFGFFLFTITSTEVWDK